MNTTDLTTGLCNRGKVGKNGIVTTPVSVFTDCILIKHQDYYQKVRYRDILYIKACGNSSEFYLMNAERLSSELAITEVIQHLPPDTFARTHDAFVVNLDYIDRYIGNMLQIGTISLPIGRQFKEEFLARLNILGA